MLVAKLGWKLLALLAGVVAARVSRRLLDSLWGRLHGGAPPRNPAVPDTSWREAVAWAAASGVSAALARLAANRGAASAWHKATGSLPPGVEEVGV